VVAGGDGIEAQQVGTLAEPVELQVRLHSMHGFGVRPWLWSLHVWIHHMRVELVGEVEHQVVDVELLAPRGGASSTSATEQQPVSLSPPHKRQS